MFSPAKIAGSTPCESPIKFDIPIPDIDFSPIKENEQEIDPSRIPTLPLKGSIPRITGKTLCDMLTGVYDQCFDSLFINDCRYNYEYEGGHIIGAQNFNSPEQLDRCFFSEIVENAIIVFHCEFSQNRGPQMAGLFRELDRGKNSLNYPNIYYPNIYILDGGYSKFYEEHPDFCEGGYTPMLEESHKKNGDLIKSTTLFRENVEKVHRKNRSALRHVTNVSSDMNTFRSPCIIMPKSNSPMTAKTLTFLDSPIVRIDH